jgi:opacity protein-like surface antigen
MIIKFNICLFVLLFFSFVEINAQTVPAKTFYMIGSFGLARSEDGLKFLEKQSASQWTPKANIGFGYRISKYLGIEIHSATMLTTLKADGTLVSNNESAKVTARHSNVIISPIFYLPISSKSELFLRTGAGILLSNTKINSMSNPNFSKSTSNIGYMVSLGYAHKVSARMTLTAQFDFSDAYGSEDVWTGDLGLLNLGVKYSFIGLNK